MSKTTNLKYAKPSVEDYRLLSQFMSELEEVTRRGFFDLEDDDDEDAADGGQPTATYEFHPARFIRKGRNGKEFDLKSYLYDRMEALAGAWRPVMFSEAVIKATCDPALDYLAWHPVLAAFIEAIDGESLDEWHLCYEYHEENGKGKFPQNCVLKGQWTGLTDKNISLAWYVDALHNGIGFTMEQQESSVHVFLPDSNLSAVVFDRDIMIIGKKVFLRSNGIHFVEIK